VRRGDAQFADYHGNLIVNLGQATSQDILTLADEYAGRVWEQFRIRLEPEILIVDDGNWTNLDTLRGKDE
jgi:UDP-N-acetylmuramate dehydrogenase